MSQPQYARESQRYAGPPTENFQAPAWRRRSGRSPPPEASSRPYEPPYHPQVTYQQGPPHPFRRIRSSRHPFRIAAVAQPFQMAPPPVAPPKRFPRWLIGLGVVVVVLVLGCIGAFALLGFGAKSVSDTITNDQKAAIADAKIGSCATDPATGFMAATVTITNHGSDQASYLVDVAFQSTNGKQQLDSTIASAEDLAAGQTATVDANVAEGSEGPFHLQDHERDENLKILGS